MKASGEPSSLGKVPAILASLWIFLCIAFFGIEASFYDSPLFPSSVKSFLKAGYLE
jgi:hypothetical protein